jgi:hypothetical protein
MRISPGLVLLFPLMLALTDSHAQIFMCKDAAGHTLTSDRPIPECADRAMRELDNRGIVRHEIPAPLTAEQKRQQLVDDETRKAEQAAARERKRDDRAIRLRYRSEADIEAARQRSLDPIQDKLQREQVSLAASQAQGQHAQSEADTYKNRHAAVPTALQRRLEAASQAAAASQKVIEESEAEIAQVNAHFDQTLQRYRELTQATAAK